MTYDNILQTGQEVHIGPAIKLKATFSVHKLIPKNAQMTTLYINWSLYINFNAFYYISQE